MESTVLFYSHIKKNDQVKLNSNKNKKTVYNSYVIINLLIVVYKYIMYNIIYFYASIVSCPTPTDYSLTVVDRQQYVDTIQLFYYLFKLRNDHPENTNKKEKTESETM